MYAKNARRGLSQIDLIIAAICLTMLCGLAMPWLVQARSQDRLRECANRLRQLCLAAHSFHDATRQLPPATIGFKVAVDANAWANDKDSEHYWHHQQNTNFCLLESPFLELNEHYVKLHPDSVNFRRSIKELRDEFDDYPVAWQGDFDGIDEVMVVAVDDLFCPEDNLADETIDAVIATQPCIPVEPDGMRAIDQAGDIALQHWTDDDQKLGLTNYVGCFGALGGKSLCEDEHRKWLGAMTSGDRVTLETILDGTSRTFLLGESLGDIEDGQRSAGMSWVWGGAARVSGLFPANAGDHPVNDEIKMLGDEKNCSAVGFGSKHDGVVNFALCDGSVSAISRGIDWEVLYKLAGANDGNRIRADEF